MLDVGFGRAGFLFQLKRLGAIPFGIELDPRALDFAKQLGIDTFKGDISDFSSDARFDVVALLDMVEHPLSLMNMLKRSSELLRKRGHILIWTPNGGYSGPDGNPATFRVDLEHMQYFTLETCFFVAAKLKLRVVHLETLGFPSLHGIDRPFSSDQVPLALA